MRVDIKFYGAASLGALPTHCVTLHAGKGAGVDDDPDDHTHVVVVPFKPKKYEMTVSATDLGESAEVTQIRKIDDVYEVSVLAYRDVVPEIDADFESNYSVTSRPLAMTDPPSVLGDMGVKRAADYTVDWTPEFLGLTHWWHAGMSPERVLFTVDRDVKMLAARKVEQSFDRKELKAAVARLGKDISMEKALQDAVVDSLHSGGGRPNWTDWFDRLYDKIEEQAVRYLKEPHRPGGSIGRLASDQSVHTSTLRLSHPNDIVNFELNDKLQFSSTDGTSGSARGGAATVVGIDRALGTITIGWCEGGPCHANVLVPAITASDFIFREGDFGRGVKKAQPVAVPVIVVRASAWDGAASGRVKDLTVSTGAKCVGCGNFNDYAESSTEYHCYSCRQAGR